MMVSFWSSRWQCRGPCITPDGRSVCRMGYGVQPRVPSRSCLGTCEAVASRPTQLLLHIFIKGAWSSTCGTRCLGLCRWWLHVSWQLDLPLHEVVGRGGIPFNDWRTACGWSGSERPCQVTGSRQKPRYACSSRTGESVRKTSP